MNLDLILPILLALGALAAALFSGDTRRPPADPTIHVTTEIHHHSPAIAPTPPPPAEPATGPAWAVEGGASVSATAADLHRAKPAPYRQSLGPARKAITTGRRELDGGADRA
jgi:hypothetical protein